MLRTMDRQLVTGISGQPVGPIFKGQAWDLIGYPKPSVINYKPALRNAPQEQGSHLHQDRSLKSYTGNLWVAVE